MSDFEMTICQASACDRPSDGWIVCRTCGDILTRTLADVGWMLDELDTVITGQTRYVTQSTGRSAEVPMPFDVKAAETRAYLMAEIATAVRLLEDANGWDSKATTERAAAAWLALRVSAIRLHVAGGDVMDGIMRWYAAAQWVIDRPAQRQFLGDCAVDPDGVACGGRIYGRAGKVEARCDTCGGIYQADELRAALLKLLADRICTAAEIAQLSSYLDLTFDRQQVRKRINQWHLRKNIEAKNQSEIDHAEEARRRGEIVERVDPTFRFEDAYLKLMQDDTHRRSA